MLPTWLPLDERAEAELVLARIVAGEDTPELVEAALDLLCVFSHHSGELGLLAGTLCESLHVSHSVRGAVLRYAMTGSKMQSPFAMFPRSDVLEWLDLASPLTLMDEAERAVLTSLPDPVEAWRGGRGVTARQAAVGLSWTLDLDRARWFANRWSPAPALVVRASFSKAAVLAYLDDPKEREVLVNWRRARGLAIVS